MIIVAKKIRTREDIWPAILEYAAEARREGMLGVNVSRMTRDLKLHNVTFVKNKYLDEAVLLGAGKWLDKEHTVFMFFDETLGTDEDEEEEEDK